MTREEQLAFCKVCKNRKKDFKLGLICEITGSKADFINECSNFIKDEMAEESEFKKKMFATGDFTTGDNLDFEKNKKTGMALIIIGVVVALMFIVLTLPFDIHIVDAGLVVGGAFMYYRGTEQEKIYNEHHKKKGEKENVG